MYIHVAYEWEMNLMLGAIEDRQGLPAIPYYVHI